MADWGSQGAVADRVARAFGQALGKTGSDAVFWKRRLTPLFGHEMLLGGVRTRLRPRSRAEKERLTPFY